MRRLHFLVLDDERGGIQHLREALALKHELTWTTNIRQAMTCLEKSATDFDLIICGTHLLSESLFDFLKQVRAEAGNKNIPFVCFRINSTSFATSVDDTIKSTTERLGANGYIVVPDISDPIALEAMVCEEIKHFIDDRAAGSRPKSQ